MGKGGAGAAALEVDNATFLAAREDDALIEGVVALGVDEAGAPQQLARVALGHEITPQAPAGGIGSVSGIRVLATHSYLVSIWCLFLKRTRKTWWEYRELIEWR